MDRTATVSATPCSAPIITGFLTISFLIASVLLAPHISGVESVSTNECEEAVRVHAYATYRYHIQWILTIGVVLFVCFPSWDDFYVSIPAILVYLAVDRILMLGSAILWRKITEQGCTMK